MSGFVLSADRDPAPTRLCLDLVSGEERSQECIVRDDRVRRVALGLGGGSGVE